MTVAAAILAGGRGKRLGGTDKKLLVVGGTPIVARQLRVLAPFCTERIVVAGDPTPYKDFDARLVTDLHPGAGPLAGLESALAATTAEALLVFACDLPFLDGFNPWHADPSARFSRHEPKRHGGQPRLGGSQGGHRVPSPRRGHLDPFGSGGVSRQGLEGSARSAGLFGWHWDL